jgi:hypothetical protein
MAYALSSPSRLERPTIQRTDRIAEPFYIALVALRILTDAKVNSSKSAMIVAPLEISLGALHR